jgi:lipid II:glycine glycyltransferase (peptidoglycan interpeptide bridge formation enzyme)
MTKKTQTEISQGYHSEVNTLDSQKWHRELQEFEDANIYQTLPYVEVTSGGRGNVSHLVLKKDGQVRAMAVVRIAKVPLLKIGIAYVRWGPIWQRRGVPRDPEVFRMALRALRNEYACKRGLVLRIFPLIFADDLLIYGPILEDEDFSAPQNETPGRTILMNLDPPLDQIRASMGGMWRRNLKSAEKNGLEVIESSDEKVFDDFIGIYKDMVSRKNFVEPNDIHDFKRIQSKLPEHLKMKVKLCLFGGQVCSGLICSAMGDSAVYLFGATSTVGMKSYGSYLLHWKLLEELKDGGTRSYNLNGINPEKNPGTYKFKHDLAGKNGRDVHTLGRFNTYDSLLSHWIVGLGDGLKARYRSWKAYQKTESAPQPQPSTAGSSLSTSTTVTEQTTKGIHP